MLAFEATVVVGLFTVVIIIFLLLPVEILRSILETYRMGEEIEVPTPEEQRAILVTKLAKSIIFGETWYIISVEWLTRLREYVGIVRVEKECIYPGPIDNSGILQPDGYEIRSGLVENIDYEVVHEDVWLLLVTWYGTIDDRTSLPRKALMITENYSAVEIYLPEIKCYKNFQEETEVLVHVSRVSPLFALEERLRMIYEIPDKANTRLWKVVTKDACEILTNLDLTLTEASIDSSVIIIIEVQSGGTWQKKRCFRPNPTGTVTLRPSSRPSSNIQVNPTVQLQGLCGLNNLGNTCFLNSVLQCLSNTPPLTDYFRAGRHLKEINTGNPLGTHGDIAKAFGDLIQIMWSGRFACTNPVHFKIEVSKFNAQFGGSQQHDAQELLTFLLDGLHEDLNRIIIKPYIEARDYAGEPDEVLAVESWINYKRRNDSIITDTFHGLFKSRVVCPECEKLSVTFDPFASLSLPVPARRERTIKVRFIPYDPAKREWLCKVTVPRSGRIVDLCRELASRFGVSSESLVVADINNSHIHKFFAQNDKVDSIEDKDTIFVYETPDHPKGNDSIALPMYFWEAIHPDDLFLQSHLFGIPLMIVLHRSDLLNFESISAAVTAQMSRHFRLPDGISENPSTSTSSYVVTTFVPRLSLLESGVIATNNPIRLDFDENGLYQVVYHDLPSLLDFDTPERIYGRKILVVQLSVQERQCCYCEQPPNVSSELGSARTEPKEGNSVVIYDCLDLFTSCEKLGHENSWYCSVCQVHQRATKKFDLWTLPRVLILHLKRFTYARYGDKIDSLVEFPLTGLTLCQYVINPLERHITYDLIGVINHYGSMSGGHYTAYCLNKNSNRWYQFDDNIITEKNPEDILTKAAYVLFYLRNDESSPVDTPVTPMDVN